VATQFYIDLNEISFRKAALIEDSLKEEIREFYKGRPYSESVDRFIGERVLGDWVKGSGCDI